jgi:hypothetical protein
MSTINPVGNAAQIATNAIRKSQENLAADAHVVANASTSVDSHETVKALVDARQQVVYTKAAARVVRAADEMVSNLLDLRT